MPGRDEAKISSHYFEKSKQTIGDSVRGVLLTVKGVYLFIFKYSFKF